MDRPVIEARTRQVLATAPHGVVTAYLFGSVARGRSAPPADVDLGVLYAQTPPPTLESLPLDLQAALERALRVPVDIVVLNRASADLVHRVLRDGILVLDRDPSVRIRFEVRKRNEYFDLLPVRRQYRRSHLAHGDTR